MRVASEDKNSRPDDHPLAPAAPARNVETKPMPAPPSGSQHERTAPPRP